MAETLLRAKTDTHVVSSAGLSVLFSASAAENACAVMEERGLDISAHRSKQLTEEMVREADLILTMTERHAALVCTFFSHARGKTKTLAAFAGKEGDVADPFGGSLETYRACAQQIESLLAEAPL